MPEPTHCAKPYRSVDMTEPTRQELVTEARRTFGESAARALAGHLRVPFDPPPGGAEVVASERSIGG